MSVSLSVSSQPIRKLGPTTFRQDWTFDARGAVGYKTRDAFDQALDVVRGDFPVIASVDRIDFKNMGMFRRNSGYLIANGHFEGSRAAVTGAMELLKSASPSV